MDRGQIVLVCPGSGSGRDRLIANFVVFDALHAAKSRADVPPERRREFYVWLDEVQIYDGASSGTLAALLEQVAKFGVRALLLNQNPERLSAATRDAVTTNRSHLVTTALNAKGAGLLARELGGEVDAETIGQLPRFHSLASVTLDGEISRPFRLAGVPVEELFPDECHPEDVPAARRGDRPAASAALPSPRRLTASTATRRRSSSTSPARGSAAGSRERRRARPSTPEGTVDRRRAAPCRALGPTAVAILESLNQHRLLSTRQVHALHTPQASRRWTQRQLARLRSGRTRDRDPAAGRAGCSGT